MKRSTTPFLLIVFFILSCSGEKDNSARYLIIENDGLFGFADTTGRVRIQTIYSEVTPFDKGVAVVRAGSKWGLIDFRGDTLRDFRLEEQFKYSEEIAAAKMGSKWGYIDIRGETIIPFKFEKAHAFQHGRAWVCLDRKWGRVDSKGTFDIDPIYDYPINSLGKGKVCRYSIGEKFGLMDSLGNRITEPKFEAMGGGHTKEGFWVLHIPLTTAKQDGKWGFIRPDGSYAISPEFSTAHAFSDGLARVSTARSDVIGGEGLYGFIDTTGAYVIPEKFTEAKDFIDGLAVVEYGGKYGYIDTKGKFVIEPRFDLASFFHEGLAPVLVKSGQYTRDWKWGFINKEGEFVVEPQFAWVSHFFGGLAEAQRTLSGPHGYINTTGEWVIYPIYDTATSFSGDSAQVSLEGETFYIDRKGRRISE